MALPQICDQELPNFYHLLNRSFFCLIIYLNDTDKSFKVKDFNVN